MFWFTSDTHFYHPKIIKYCNRPFKTVQEMNYVLVERWNEKVRDGDTVFHLGDFCFKITGDKLKELTDQLNGNIILVRGNHDNERSYDTPILDVRIRHFNREFLLVHRPEESSPGYYLVLSGHVHDKWLCKSFTFNKYTWNCFNVGVDVHDYYPITIEHILEEYNNWLRNNQSNM